jgi:cell division septation protein DedD
VTVPPAPKSATEPVAKAAVPAVVAEPAKTPEIKDTSVPAVPPTARRLPEPPPAQENATPSTSISVGKSKSPVVVKPAVPAVAAVPEKIAEKPAAEQLALLRKPEPAIVEKKPLARRVPRPLEGFIIQIAFSDKEKAQNWAEKMEQRGYAVSVTEAGTAGALRVRLGNFSARDDAERQLRSFKQEGMNGIVINLPQAFRPVARSSVP